MKELFEQFGINWKLLGAQVVNFAILLFILKKFAYGPLLEMLNERRKRIAEGLAAATASKKRLAEADEEKGAILTEARKESLGIVQGAEQLAKDKVKLILSDGQKQAAGIVEEAGLRAAEEKLKMKDEFSRESASFLKSALAKIVEKSTEALDDNLIKGVVEELKKV